MSEPVHELVAAARQPGRFDADTAVTGLPDGALEAHLDPRWSVGRGPNGGYLAAIILRALARAVEDPGRTPRSVTIHFIQPATEAQSLRIHPVVEREGRLLTNVSARVTQGDRLIALALGAFSRDRPGGPEFSELAMPAFAAPEEVAPIEYVPGVMPPIASCWQQRLISALPFSGADRAEITAWARLPEGRPWDEISILALSDGVIPAITPRLSLAPLVFPTIDLTAHFRNPVPDTVRPTDFLLGRFRTRLAAGGFFEEDGQIWTRDGLLLAQSRQLMVVMERRR